jgi:hypothetical protein
MPGSPVGSEDDKKDKTILPETDSAARGSGAENIVTPESRDMPVGAEPSGKEELKAKEWLAPALAVSPTSKSGGPETGFAGLPEGTFFYVRNAGVVLLHPFFPAFFREFNLLKDNDFADEIVRHKAVHLIHYLATGETQPPEYELTLPRFLCEIPFDAPLERWLELEDDEKTESEKLLNSVIGYWPALKNTTPDGLREGFLRREGKLEKRQSGWHLVVEQKTLDILLAKLSWGFRTVKLPWMKELLRVEWA